MGSATDLFDLAVEVLDASIEILATTEGGAPDRAFVTHALPALDCCDQLTVHIASIGEAATQAGTVLQPGMRHSLARVNLTALQITITRCVPPPKDDGTMPNPAEQEVAEKVMSQDAWALWCGLFRRGEELFSDCDLVFFDGLIPLQEQGGCAGYVMTIRFELQGYAPPAGS